MLNGPESLIRVNSGVPVIPENPAGLAYKEFSQFNESLPPF